MVLELRVHVGKDRKVTLHLPPEFEDDEVRITVESTRTEQAETTPLTFKGLSLGEIMKSEYVGSWSDLDIEDSQTWVDDVRQQIQERRDWPTDS